jgi:hypothetical protein
MYFNKMVYWEICCRATEMGFQCELPEGTYFLGDPNEMMLPGIGATIKHLKTGTFSDAESEGIIVIHDFIAREFILKDQEGEETLITSESGTIALMSAEIVKPDAKYSEQQIVFNKRTVVAVNVETESIEMKSSDYTIVMSPFEEDYPEESDEQMYVRLYAAQGIEY